MFITSSSPHRPVWLPSHLAMKQPGISWMQFFNYLMRHLYCNCFKQEDVQIHMTSAEIRDVISVCRLDGPVFRVVHMTHLGAVVGPGYLPNEPVNIAWDYGNVRFMGFDLLNDIPEVK